MYGFHLSLKNYWIALGCSLWGKSLWVSWKNCELQTQRERNYWHILLCYAYIKSNVRNANKTLQWEIAEVPHNIPSCFIAFFPRGSFLRAQSSDWFFCGWRDLPTGRYLLHCWIPNGCCHLEPYANITSASNTLAQWDYRAVQPAMKFMLHVWCVSRKKCELPFDYPVV